jgi:hypothetical protein
MGLSLAGLFLRGGLTLDHPILLAPSPGRTIGRLNSCIDIVVLPAGMTTRAFTATVAAIPGLTAAPVSGRLAITPA